MKWILPILLLISLSVKCQLNTLTKKEIKMDSISMVKFDLHFKLDAVKSSMGYRPTPKVKITFKTRLNLNVSDSSTVYDVIQEVEDNIVGIMKYDIRCKVYLNKSFSLVGRGLIDNEKNFGKDMYSLGLMGKF